jgi:protein SCO1/2
MRFPVIPSLFCATLVFLTGCSNKPPLPSLGMVPDFTLTDQSGQPFASTAKLAGKIWVADFIFTNCAGPCPRMSSQMRQVREAIQDPSVHFVSFTVDPARDTPVVLAEYSKRFHPDPTRWTLLTGSPADLRKLSFDAFHLNDVNGDLEHSTRFVLVDRKSRIRGYYLTSEKESIPTLISDIQSLLKESS